MSKRKVVKKRSTLSEPERKKRTTLSPASLEWLYKQLMMEGLLSKPGIPRQMDQFVPFDPVPVRGKAASEIIIEDRVVG